nr:MAG TPA: hypothetical protein [Caudoviricetes sp.]DAX25008.1 MAG TPA: hypothetical protein [Caudoviricetes sp.]
MPRLCIVAIFLPLYFSWCSSLKSGAVLVQSADKNI